MRFPVPAKPVPSKKATSAAVVPKLPVKSDDLKSPEGTSTRKKPVATPPTAGLRGVANSKTPVRSDKTRTLGVHSTSTTVSYTSGVTTTASGPAATTTLDPVKPVISTSTVNLGKSVTPGKVATTVKPRKSMTLDKSDTTVKPGKSLTGRKTDTTEKPGKPLTSRKTDTTVKPGKPLSFGSSASKVHHKLLTTPKVDVFTTSLYPEKSDAISSHDSATTIKARKSVLLGDMSDTTSIPFVSVIPVYSVIDKDIDKDDFEDGKSNVSDTGPGKPELDGEFSDQLRSCSSVTAWRKAFQEFRVKCTCVDAMTGRKMAVVRPRVSTERLLRAFLIGLGGSCSALIVTSLVYFLTPKKVG
ncbi:hypothetical protein ElyMa_001133400 [Elysia marginata]|uniref:Uncharacterized protein n=1 Tax=Elysia marginata TaxID=1093978 RepID=A0AAV4HY16_9GAST|nr:hypothetical protein ElyMa_001133400 [Elysia marginata]